MKKTMFRVLTLGAFFCITLFSCKESENGSNSARNQFIETQFIDSSMKPGDDFYHFVNGKWLDTASIPNAYTMSGSAIDVYLEIQRRLKGLLEEASKNNPKMGSIEQKVGDYFVAGMDTATINKLGYDPIKPFLSKIDAVTDISSLMHCVSEMEKDGHQTLIYLSVFPDLGNSSINIANLAQTGLGLPDRDYYFRTDAGTIGIQNAYKNLIKKLFVLTGTDSVHAIKNMEVIYAIEKQMAASHKTNVELRDVQGNYNKAFLTKLALEQPNIHWEQFFKTLQVSIDSLNLEQPGYYVKLNELLSKVPVEDWKIYLKSRVLVGFGNFLSQPFQDAKFEYTKVISGQKEQRQRWERIASNADRDLGEALGQLYVKKYFPQEAKLRIDTLIGNLMKATSIRIHNLDWMSDSTKVLAEEKLKAMRRKIGFPEKWRDYSKVQIDKNTYLENVVACDRNNFNYELSLIGQKVDQSLWRMTPQTLNAYYDPMHNDINFPAGILQFPFFDKDADDAVNYGAIGMVIGHEIIHGFDDMGSQFDKLGNIGNWWSVQDKARFDEKVKQIQHFYDGFIVLDSVHVNGKLTTGENIADFGGVAIAYDAFKMTKAGQDTTKIDGYTPEQRFFMSLAQVWRSKSTDESLKQRINLDPHSPDNWRVNGPLMNFGPFYKAFNVQPGDKMYIDEKDRIKIW